MFSVRIGGVTCKLSLLFPAVLLWMLWWDRSGVVLLAVAAAFLHEGGHLATSLVFGKHPRELSISFYGMRLTYDGTASMSWWQEGTVALMGPLVNLLCAIILGMCDVSEMFVLCHLGLAAVNLLPIGPLDGAVALSCLLHALQIASYRVDRILHVCSCLCFACLCLAGFTVCAYNGNITLLLFAMYTGVFVLFYKGN